MPYSWQFRDKETDQPVPLGVLTEEDPFLQATVMGVLVPFLIDHHRTKVGEEDIPGIQMFIERSHGGFDPEGWEALDSSDKRAVGVLLKGRTFSAWYSR